VKWKGPLNANKIKLRGFVATLHVRRGEINTNRNHVVCDFAISKKKLS
jgi:hypothetical protein